MMWLVVTGAVRVNVKTWLILVYSTSLVEGVKLVAVLMTV